MEKINVELIEEKIKNLQNQAENFSAKYLSKDAAARDFDNIKNQIINIKHDVEDVRRNMVTKDSIATVKWIAMSAGGIVVGLVIQNFLK